MCISVPGVPCFPGTSANAGVFLFLASLVLLVHLLMLAHYCSWCLSLCWGKAFAVIPSDADFPLFLAWRKEGMQWKQWLKCVILYRSFIVYKGVEGEGTGCPITPPCYFDP